MAKEKYEINKYTSSIIEGLGYEVVRGEGMQGVSGIIRKSDQRPVPRETGNILNLSEEEWERGYSDLMAGVPTAIYQDSGLNAYLSTYGDTDLYFPGNLEISLSDYDEEKDKMEIIISDGKNCIKITYRGAKSVHPDYLRNSIKVEGNTDRDLIAHVENCRTKWRDYSMIYPLDTCTVSRVTKHLIHKIRTYEKGAYWTPKMKRGLEIVTPALAHMVLDFKRDWMTLIDEYVAKEKDYQKDQDARVNALLDGIANSRVTVSNLTSAKEQLQQSLAKKPKQKKPREVRVEVPLKG